MTPCAATVVYGDVATPLGMMRLAANPMTLLGAWFLDQWDLPAMTDDWQQRPDHPVVAQAGLELEQWFQNQRRSFDVALQAQGTAFQQEVWRALQALPFGTTVSYSELSRSIGRPRAVRAVAGAVGRNPISIFIPCHRVVGKDTSLTGFGGGLPRKQALLAHEGHRYMGGSAQAKAVPCTQLALPW